jgi:hypothetical protein
MSRFCAKLSGQFLSNDSAISTLPPAQDGLIFIKALRRHAAIETKSTLEDSMRETLLALSAATVIAAGAVAAPTPSHANGVAVAAIVAGAVVATVFVVHAVAHPAYDGRHHHWRHRHHHRHHHR